MNLKIIAYVASQLLRDWYWQLHLSEALKRHTETLEYGRG